jgi:hypothetical protein
MTNLPPPNIGQSKSIKCWNCGEDTVTAICALCGCDVLVKPALLVDNQQAAISGAISGAIFGALFSSKEHRVRNSALGALWGSSSANNDAQYVNSAFAAGAPLNAISQHRKRRFGYFCGITLGWAVLLTLTSSAATPGVAIIAMPPTWYTCKYLAKLTNWYRKPLYEYGIVKKAFGFWEPGDTDLGVKKIVKRYKIIAVVLMVFQILMTGAGT